MDLNREYSTGKKHLINNMKLNLARGFWTRALGTLLHKMNNDLMTINEIERRIVIKSLFIL